ncbi:unnamed protein product [Ilex paraguariensis]|uniref:AMP-dependent synthetase/ligase domain-containing protein n=1 Tax=Ilex paraguariensis TaxID=185542 RepID=A0ABC8RY27_9AQUA
MAYKALDCLSSSDIAALGIPSKAAEQFYQKLTEIVGNYGAATPETWQHVSKHLLNPELPFSLHQMMYYGCYKDFGPDPPAWLPDPELANSTNVGQLLGRRGKEFLGSKYKDPISSFSEFQDFSVSTPEVYWTTILDEMNISFSVSPECILREDPSHPGGQWLPGACLNPAKNCLSLNSKRTLDDIMVISRDEGDDEMPINKMTLKELRSAVWLVAYAVEALGLEKGSAIAINMPMDINSVVIYLAIVLAGYVVVSIADSFAPSEISTRLIISKTKAIFTQDLIVRGNRRLPLYSRVVDAQSPMAIVIPTRGSSFSIKLRDGDISWHDFLERVKDSKDIEFVAVEQPVEAFTNILFSSGTTGEPKAIPWTLATPLKAAADGWCHMDIRKGDVVAWPTNLGWMMGPWLVYASLLNGASIALYNGSPLGSGFAKFVQDAKVTMLGLIPSLVRAWKTANCTAGYDWTAVRCFGSTGEASSVDEYLWLMGRAQYKPIIEYCGGTEIGGGFVSGSLLQPQSLAAFSTPAMGCTLFILGEDGIPIPPNTPGTGELALGPLMFGASSTLLNADHHEVYFKRMPVWNGKVLRRHGDVFERTSRGYYHAHGRADDTMNLGGIKVSSVEIERICNAVDNNVLETAATGVPPPGGGPESLMIAVVFKDSNSSATDLDKLKMSFNSALQKKLNPLFKVSYIIPLSSLPRTATNKVLDLINWVDKDRVIDIYVDHIKQSQVESNCGTIQQEVGVETDHFHEQHLESSGDGDMNDSDSSNYESFYDSEYDIIDDQLYETFVDKDVEFVGKDKGKGIDKWKGVDSERGTTEDIDNDLYAEDYDSEELLTLSGSSSDDEEGGHYKRKRVAAIENASQSGSNSSLDATQYKSIKDKQELPIRRKRNTSCASTSQPPSYSTTYFFITTCLEATKKNFNTTCVDATPIWCNTTYPTQANQVCTNSYTTLQLIQESEEDKQCSGDTVKL